MNRLQRTARTLGRRRNGGKALPVLWLFTDPARTPDPASLARRLPRGSGIVFRAFGTDGAEATGLALAAVARRRGLILLVGADEALAVRIGAQGLHLPERLATSAVRLRARRPTWLITAAAHSARALARAGALRLDAAFVSVAFESRSPSAEPAMGPVRLARLVSQAATPVIALGGVNARTAPRLEHTRVAGLAAVEGWLEA